MIRKAVVLFLCLVLAAFSLLSAAVSEQGGQKTVRVGWYDTPFNRKDSFGRRTGYAYEYQRKIAAYTGWKYEYVEGNWPELLQMLQDGRIDLMSDVSFSEDRTEYMLYSSLPMGEELYYLYVFPGSTAISVEDLATLNGKKVGVTRSSVQKDLFLRWAEARNVSVNLVELSSSEEESLDLLGRGELDAFVTLDTYGDPEVAIPMWKIGSSDFFFACSKNRPDLLAELDTAMNRIQDENKNYNEQLNAKYLRSSSTNLYLTVEEREWLTAHGPIRVGYQDNYLAFCATDPKTGELTGALKDYLALASGVLKNASPDFTAAAYPTAAAAIEALKNGEVDCMFPANLTDYDGEVAGVVMTAPLMCSKMDAVIRSEDQQDFLRRPQVRVAVNRGNPNYERFLLDNYPSWTPVFYADTPACLDAVAAKTADCLIVSTYRYRDIARQCERLNLTTVYTGVDMDFSLAVREGNTVLYSVISRIISQMPASAANAALTYYSAETVQPQGLGGFFLVFPVPAVLSAAAALVLIVSAVRAFINIQKKAGKASSRP